MKQISPTALSLTREEAHCLLRPTVDGYSTWLFDTSEMMCKYSPYDDDYVSIDTTDLTPDGGLPNDWSDFQIWFEDADSLTDNKPYLEGCLEENGFVQHFKNLRTRLGDIWQKCREYLLHAGLTSNKYGEPRPGVLDLWSLNYTIEWTNPIGDKHHGRIIALIQPMDMLIVEIKQDDSTYYGYVKIDDLDIFQLTDLVDEIRRINLQRVLYKYLSDSIDDYVLFLEKNRPQFKQGEEVVYFSTILQDNGTYKYEYQLAYFEKMDDTHAILLPHPQGIDVAYNCCLWQVRKNNKCLPKRD